MIVQSTAGVVRLAPHFRKRTRDGQSVYVQTGLVYEWGTIQGGNFCPDGKSLVDEREGAQGVLAEGVLQPLALLRWLTQLERESAYVRNGAG